MMWSPTLAEDYKELPQTRPAIRLQRSRFLLSDRAGLGTAPNPQVVLIKQRFFITYSRVHQAIPGGRNEQFASAGIFLNAANVSGGRSPGSSFIPEDIHLEYDLHPSIMF
jgi:hypothetical protein